MIITNGIIISQEKVLTGKAVLIKEGKIQELIKQDDVNYQEQDIVDANGGYILPGLIDIHTHGGAGSDIMDATYEAFKDITVFHASHGVTSILGTTMSAPFNDILRTLQFMKETLGEDFGGANILGAHVEGPFLSFENRGAHPAEFLLTPELSYRQQLMEYAGVIKSITLSPELTGSLEFIAQLAKRGIIISGGHDMAVDEEIIKAIEQGMTHTTHIFCSMSNIVRRDTTKHLGLTQMALLKDSLTVEIIADNKHIPPMLGQLVYKCKGPQKMCVVSDCLSVAGLPQGNKTYTVGPKSAAEKFQVVVDDGVAMLPDRSLNAGSITTLDKMIYNLVHDCNISLKDAVRMASLSPAEIIRYDKQKGSIEAGKDADICIMDDKLNVQKTIVGGKVVFEK